MSTATRHHAGTRFSAVITTVWSHRPVLLYLAVFYAAYVLAGASAAKLQIIPGHTTAFWPAAGIFVATLLSTRRQTWAWWVIVGCLAEMTCNVFWFRNSIPAALGFYVANALEALTAAWLLTRFIADPFRLDSPKEVAGLIVFGAGVAPVVGATVGSLTHAIFGTKTFTSVWALWWLGDASGLLVATPLAIAALQTWQSRTEVSVRRAIEAAILAVTLIGVGTLAFKGYLPTAYVTLPPLLWAALRFQLKGAAVALAIIALMSATFTVTGTGEFTGSPEEMEQRVVMLKAFLGLSAVSALIVAVLSHQHQRALLALSGVNEELERRVAERTAELGESERRLRFAHQAAGLGAWEYDFDSGKAVWSDQARTLVGVAPHESVSLNLLLSRVHPDDRARLEAEFDRVRGADTGRAYRAEFRVIHADGSRLWLEDQGQVEFGATGQPRRAVGIMRDVTERKMHEEKQRLLMHEVNHRGKNMLALVQAIARQTAATEPKAFFQRFSERIYALAANQDLLVKSDWKGVQLDELVRSQLAHFSDLVDKRIKLGGPTVILTSQAAQSIGMAVHELATNAGKYGALSNSEGTIEIAWKLRPESGGERFTMTWREMGGPPVTPPSRKGFGSVVTTTMAMRALYADVTVDYASGGFVWTLECNARTITDDDVSRAEAACRA